MKGELFPHLDRCLNAVKSEFNQLITIKKTTKPWPIPVLFSIALGLPTITGAWISDLSSGLTASLGSLVFLYTTEKALPQRLKYLISSSLVMIFCHLAGIVSAADNNSKAIGFAIVTTLTTWYCRKFSLGGPSGSLFFVICASAGASNQILWAENSSYFGFLIAGCFWGIFIGFLHYTITPFTKNNSPYKAPQEKNQKILTQSLCIGCFTGGGLFLAEFFNLENSHWISVSCLAVIQEGSTKDIWRKLIHRITGTVIGIFILYIIYKTTPITDIHIALWVTFLALMIEMTITKNYAIATIFITPMAIILIDTKQTHQTIPWSLTQSRLLNTVLGCFIGLLGGALLNKNKQSK